MTEWRYLRGGTVKHAFRKSTDAAALCGMDALPRWSWWGSGSQEEYDRLESLRPCMRCERKLDARA